MSFGPIPLYRICTSCGYHFVDDGGTLSINRKSFLKCPKCGSDSIEDEIKQKEYNEEIKRRNEEFHKRMETIAKSHRQV